MGEFQCSDFLFPQSPLEPLPNFKSPCWMSKLEGDPYVNRTIYHRCDRISDYYKTEMRQIYKNRLQDGLHWRMRCFPYAMLIGVTKSGTTDIFSRIAMHPEIYPSGVKETWFWAKYRMQGMIIYFSSVSGYG
jgi:N-acetylgalactosamine 4-sulfate 6-O-sulfotransferase